MKNKIKKRLVLVFVGLLALTVMFIYINRYLYKFFAAGDAVKLNMSTQNVSANMNETVNVGIILADQNIAGAELDITYDPAYLQYPASGQSGFSQVGNYFSTPLIEKVETVNANTKKIHLVIVSTENSTVKSHQINLAFKPLKTGTSQVTILVSSKVAGTDSSNQATYFENDITNNTTNVTITEATISPTGDPTITEDPEPTNTTPNPTNVTPEPTDGDDDDDDSDNDEDWSDIDIVGTGDTTIRLKLRLQGVTKMPKIEKTIKVDVELVEASSGEKVADYDEVPFKVNDQMIWRGGIKTDTESNTEYVVQLKGSKHLKKQVCDNTPDEEIPGTYHCSGRESDIFLWPATHTFDFSNILMLAGDIPEQNGVIDAVDLAYIRQNFGNQDKEKLIRGDLNLDGIIDSQDFSLIIAALGFKYDEE